MLIDPARAAYDKLQASVSEYRKTSPYSRDKPYGEALTFEDFKTSYDEGTDFRQPTYSGQPMQPLQSASGGLGGLLSSAPGMGLLSRFPGSGNATPGPVDPIMQGFQESEFHKNANKMQQDAIKFKYKGKDTMMNSSMHGAFTQYLDSIGKRDLYQGPLGPGLVGGRRPLPDLGINNNFIGINPDSITSEAGPPSEIPLSMQQPISGLGAPPQGIGSLTPTPQQPGLGGLLGSGNENSFTPQQPVMPTSPYQEQLTGFGEQLTGFGNQLTGFNDQFGGFNDQFGGLDKQFDMINTRLNSVDEGIASLSKQSQPQQQSYNSPYPNFNFRTNSYSNSNSSPFGLSSLFMGRY